MRLAVLIAGIFSFGVGIVMVIVGTTGGGVIKLEFRELLKGEMQTGSAGLFVIFFSFFLIVLSFLLGKAPKTEKAKKSKLREMVVVTIVLWGITAPMMVGGKYIGNTNEGIFIGVMGLIAFWYALDTTYLTYRKWKETIEDKPKETPKPTQK